MVLLYDAYTEFGAYIIPIPGKYAGQALLPPSKEEGGLKDVT
jgi:hypothetical protein